VYVLLLATHALFCLPVTTMTCLHVPALVPQNWGTASPWPFVEENGSLSLAFLFLFYLDVLLYPVSRPLVLCTRHFIDVATLGRFWVVLLSLLQPLTKSGRLVRFFASSNPSHVPEFTFPLVDYLSVRQPLPILFPTHLPPSPHDTPLPTIRIRPHLHLRGKTILFCDGISHS